MKTRDFYTAEEVQTRVFQEADPMATVAQPTAGAQPAATAGAQPAAPAKAPTAPKPMPIDQFVDTVISKNPAIWNMYLQGVKEAFKQNNITSISPSSQEMVVKLLTDSSGNHSVTGFAKFISGEMPAILRALQAQPAAPQA